MLCSFIQMTIHHNCVAKLLYLILPNYLPCPSIIDTYIPSKYKNILCEPEPSCSDIYSYYYNCIKSLTILELREILILLIPIPTNPATLESLKLCLKMIQKDTDLLGKYNELKEKYESILSIISKT